MIFSTPLVAQTNKVVIIDATTDVVLNVLSNHRDDVTPCSVVERTTDDKLHARYKARDGRTIDAIFQESIEDQGQTTKYECSLEKCLAGGLEKFVLTAIISPVGNKTKISATIVVAVAGADRMKTTTASVMIIRQFESSLLKQLGKR